MGARAALLLRGARRRHRGRQPVGVERGHRQGRLPARARRQPVGALPGGVPLQRRRTGRVDHRSRLGRARDHLRERDAPRGVEALRRRGAARLRRRRPRPAAGRPHAAEHVRRHGAAPSRRCGAVPQRRIFAAAAGRQALARTAHREVPLRPQRCREPRPALRGGLPHPGAGARHAHALDRREEARHRRLGRPRLHAGAHRVRACHG